MADLGQQVAARGAGQDLALGLGLGVRDGGGAHGGQVPLVAAGALG
jgi:hypothetical protein